VLLEDRCAPLTSGIHGALQQRDVQVFLLGSSHTRQGYDIAELERLGLWKSPAELEPFLEQALELPPPQPATVAHGDLHIRHLLVDGGAAAGVIDWGDVCLADPAIDLPLLWSFVPPDGRRAFLDAYGPVNEAQLQLSRLLSVQLCAVLAHYGHAERQPEILRAGLDGLARTLAG